MDFFDLSHEIHEGMPVFPGMSQPVLRRPFTVQEHGFQETLITMLSHTGTHMDAPAHMLPGGKSLEQYPVSSFAGKAWVMDGRGIGDITPERLQGEQQHIGKADFLLIHTGWSALWGKPGYFEGFPALTSEAAEWLTRFNLKGIGYDVISADKHDSTDFPIHHILFRRNMLIIENLTGLESLTGREVFFSSMPLKYRLADGSPVRAIAWVS